ncbi:MAG: SWIM zinc finger family protein [Thermorudis peleae]|nr:SWIM zinc finger family protein [Thermorudis peleae]
MVTAAQAKAISERYQKALEIVEAGRVHPLYGQAGRYAVVNGEGYAYLVDVVAQACSCPDAAYRAKRLDVPCKHLIAAGLVAERQRLQTPQEQAEEQATPQPAARTACRQCGLLIEAGMLCDACEASARALLADLV